MFLPAQKNSDISPPEEDFHETKICGSVGQ
jgi:hypothetical protein